MSAAAAKTVYDCRCELAELFSAKPESVVFTLNTTHALNIAIKGIARKGDHILISNMEHNSVLRPIIAEGYDYDVFDTLKPTEAMIREICSRITSRTRGIVCTHHSNICPVGLPIGAVGELCRQRGLFFIVDAAQTAGIYPIDMSKCNIDALCFAGHKSLYGIQGVGGIVFSQKYKGKAARMLHTLVQGGSGMASLEENMPLYLPERLEAGTLATPAIAGLLAGVKEVRQRGLADIRDHGTMLCRRMLERLCNDDRIEVYCPDMQSSEIVLFNIKGVSPDLVAEALDKEGICVRAGFHCAPLAHRALGTGDKGAVRVSFGAYNTPQEVDIFCDTLQKVKQGV